MNHKTIELSQIVKEMREINTRLNGAIKEVYAQANLKSQTERDYKIALRHEILKLKSEGHPATLIQDLAKGAENVAELRFQRDKAKTLYDTARDSMNSLRVEASVLQTISKYQDE